MNSPAQEFQSVISLEKYAELAQHPKKEVRKWVGERLKDLDKAETFPILQTLMNDTSDEIAIFAMTHLAEKQQISTYSGGAKGGANSGDIYLHLLTLIGIDCQPVA